MANSTNISIWIQNASNLDITQLKKIATSLFYEFDESFEINYDKENWILNLETELEISQDIFFMWAKKLAQNATITAKNLGDDFYFYVITNKEGEIENFSQNAYWEGFYLADTSEDKYDFWDEVEICLEDGYFDEYESENEIIEKFFNFLIKPNRRKLKDIFEDI